MVGTNGISMAFELCVVGEYITFINHECIICLCVLCVLKVCMLVGTLCGLPPPQFSKLGINSGVR